MSESEDGIFTLSDFENDSDVSETEHCDEGPSSSKRPRRTPTEKCDTPPEASSWTLAEKKKLLQAIREYGTGNLTAIACSIPTKSAVDIKEMLTKKWKELRSSVKGKDGGKETPIDKWITHLSKKIPNDDHKFFIASRVLKYIALFEERDGGNESAEGVNLTDVYLILSSLFAGEGPKFSNRETSAFLYGVFQNFAKEIKRQEFKSEKKYLTPTFRPTPVRKCYGKQKSSVASDFKDPVNNPLNIPKDIL